MIPHRTHHTTLPLLSPPTTHNPQPPHLQRPLVAEARPIIFRRALIDEVHKYSAGKDRFAAWSKTKGSPFVSFQHVWGLTATPFTNGLFDLVSWMCMVAKRDSLHRPICNPTHNVHAEGYDGEHV